MLILTVSLRSLRTRIGSRWEAGGFRVLCYGLSERRLGVKQVVVPFGSYSWSADIEMLVTMCKQWADVKSSLSVSALRKKDAWIVVILFVIYMPYRPKRMLLICTVWMWCGLSLPEFFVQEANVHRYL